MPIGVFPGWSELNRRTVRAPVNPLDKSTIVSVYPYEIKEKKPTLMPGEWTIPAGSMKEPGLLVVGPSSWWKEVDPEQPLLELPVASILIADSLIKDWCNGLVGATVGVAMPGLFYVHGEKDIDEIREKHSLLLIDANNKQRKWYEELVKIADVAWARTNGNPLSINETMKAAAKELGFDDREWLRSFHTINMVRCFACGTMKNPQYPVCPTCRAIDPSFKGDIQFAGG